MKTSVVKLIGIVNCSAVWNGSLWRRKRNFLASTATENVSTPTAYSGSIMCRLAPLLYLLVSSFFIHVIVPFHTYAASNPSKKETQSYIVDFLQNYQHNSGERVAASFDGCNLVIDTKANPYFHSIWYYPIANMTFYHETGTFGSTPSTQIHMDCTDNSQCVKILTDGKPYFQSAHQIFINPNQVLGGKLVKALEHLRGLCGGKK